MIFQVKRKPLHIQIINALRDKVRAQGREGGVIQIYAPMLNAWWDCHIGCEMTPSLFNSLFDDGFMSYGFYKNMETGNEHAMYFLNLNEEDKK